ncbi:MAG: hypothetical protein AVDCRST_MAG95-2990 [uncultured Adhaeribacter sp.]|uniref:Uncharacterized protein n=1 Tax=uncultured Adhaeribacter sp. TaxID=448109 RepID=A0A6J4JFG7_9BACT|nr:MAG: hypothetical protein AVDCRST_MAG95-2990 [uncultured Adhaeribacter sp.]
MAGAQSYFSFYRNKADKQCSILIDINGEVYLSRREPNSFSVKSIIN